MKKKNLEHYISRSFPHSYKAAFKYDEYFDFNPTYLK
jgi:hypothetical protein